MTKIEKKLLDAGIPANLKGFWCLSKAIELYEPGMRVCELYYAVADYFSTGWGTVERAMRHAISKTDINLTAGQYVAKTWLEMQQIEINLCLECNDEIMEGNPILYQHSDGYTSGPNPGFLKPKIAKFCPKCGRDL